MFYTPLIHKAIDFAIEVHRTKKRKGKDIPYIVHPLTVALILSRVSDDEEIIVAGILHDTIEDCKPYGSVTKEMIAKVFTPRVAELVDSVTEPNKDLPWIERKQAALAHIKDMDHDQLLLKSADVLQNLSDLNEDIVKKGLKVFKSFNATQDLTLGRYNSLREELSKTWPDNPLLSEIKEGVSRLFEVVKAAKL
jgi:(p)ppGpp synthase/HD superfamily hydrolase